MANALPFEDVERVERADGEPALLVDVDGFEGPLDLLLELARRQKVDLHKISILALAEQYITFIEAARRMRLELAADYLVMAAWLAYLKSRLLLPEPPKGEEPSADDLATALALRLRRLEAIREAAKSLASATGSGATFFPAGRPSLWSSTRISVPGDALRSPGGLCAPAAETAQQPGPTARRGTSGPSRKPERRWSGWSAI